MTDVFKTVNTEQLDKILECIKLHKHMSTMEIAELGTNHKEAIEWLESHNLISKEIVDGNNVYCLKEIQQNEISKKEVQIQTENGKKEKGS